jgi:hypothetical protein
MPSATYPPPPWPAGGGKLRPARIEHAPQLLWKEHDAYTKALDRLLRDLRVEKA